jgi:hypothetical protein
MPRRPQHGGPRARLLLSLATVLTVAAVTALAAQQLTVQVRETQLRQRPSYLGAGSGAVTYGQRLDVLAAQGPWRQVKTPDGQRGWLHISVLSEKKLRLQSGETDAATGADLDEIALAGKGFTEEVEKAFQEGNQEVDYTWVDRMAAWNFTPTAASAFLAAGEVVPREGGAR